MKAILVFAAFLLLTTVVAQQHKESRPNGVIYGTAIGQDGQPAKGVRLTACPVGVALATRLPHAATDDRGEYRFENLPWWANTPSTLKTIELDTQSSVPLPLRMSLQKLR